MKVFCWSDGLYAYTVATSSRSKALAAWGFRRDLFKDGEAKEVTHGEDHDRALASPGVTVKRGLGASTGEVRTLKPAKLRREPPRPSKADLARVERLQTEIAALSEDHRTQAAAIDRQRRALADRQAKLVSAFEARRAALDDRLREARAKLEPR